MADEQTAVTEYDPAMAIAENVNDESFKEVASATDFLPRFTLYASSSDAVKEEKIQAGRWGYNEGSNHIDLGKETQILVLGVRLKALDITGKIPASFFTPGSEHFERVKAMSKVKNSRNLCGPDFLIWIPSVKIFATFYMSSYTMKKEAALVRAAMGKFLTLKVTLHDNGENKWHGPVITGCSMELARPSPEKLAKEAARFKNEKDTPILTAADKAAIAAQNAGGRVT